jgi:hypothetical protein
MKPIGFIILMILFFIASVAGNRAWAQVTYFNDAGGNLTGTATQLGFMTLYQDASNNFVGTAINLQPMPYVPSNQAVSQPMPMMPPFAPLLMPLLPLQPIFGGTK